MTTRRVILRDGLRAMVALPMMGSMSARAADFPNRPVTVVYPLAAGGIGDASARVSADGLKKYLNGTVVVENRPGAGGAIGAMFVKQAKPDGYTLLAGGASALVYTPILQDTPYDPLRDFRIIALTDSYGQVMVTGKASGYTTVKSVVDAAKAGSKPMLYGSAGAGTSPALAAQWFAKINNLQMEAVNYKGNAPAIPDVISGRIPFMFMSLQTASAHIGSGAMVGLAITTTTRLKEFPNLPTFSEAGFADFNKLDWAQWNAVFAPVGVPRDEMQALSEALQKTVSDPEFQTRYIRIGSSPYRPMTLDQANETYRTSYAQWQAAIKELSK